MVKLRSRAFIVSDRARKIAITGASTLIAAFCMFFWDSKKGGGSANSSDVNENLSQPVICSVSKAKVRARINTKLCAKPLVGGSDIFAACLAERGVTG